MIRKRGSRIVARDDFTECGKFRFGTEVVCIYRVQYAWNIAPVAKLYAAFISGY